MCFMFPPPRIVDNKLVAAGSAVVTSLLLYMYHKSITDGGVGGESTNWLFKLTPGFPTQYADD